MFIWDWALKNQGFSHRVSVVRAQDDAHKNEMCVDIGIDNTH